MLSNTDIKRGTALAQRYAKKESCLKSYTVKWQHDVTKEILELTVEALNVTLGALKMVTAFELSGENIDCWKALNTIN